MARRRRRLRYSLRALLALTLVVSCACAWVHRAQQQRAAVHALLASNPSARVLYARSQGGQADAPSALAEWLEQRLGADFIRSVAGVKLMYATDADLTRAARLPGLRSLSLIRSVDLTDAGLALVAAMKHLRRLVITDAEQVTDAGLAQLANLKSLEYLQIDLGRHRVSPHVLQSLRRALPKCRIETGQARDDAPVLVARRATARFDKLAPAYLAPGQ
jgi:hypothetical protein